MSVTILTVCCICWHLDIVRFYGAVTDRAVLRMIAGNFGDAHGFDASILCCHLDWLGCKQLKAVSNLTLSAEDT